MRYLFFFIFSGTWSNQLYCLWKHMSGAFGLAWQHTCCLRWWGPLLSLEICKWAKHVLLEFWKHQRTSSTSSILTICNCLVCTIASWHNWPMCFRRKRAISVTFDRYENIINECFLPTLNQIGMENLWFQQDSFVAELSLTPDLLEGRSVELFNLLKHCFLWLNKLLKLKCTTYTPVWSLPTYLNKVFK